MFDYTGKECFGCGEAFSAGDDIVVCPDCGTPYHRACYMQEGRCSNNALHESGESWQKNEKRRAECVCRICGEHNEPDAPTCSHCGRSLSLNGTTTDPNMAKTFPLPNTRIPFGDKYCGMNPDEDFDGVKLSEIADYIGVNTWYYLPIFKQMKQSGKKISFNFSALIFHAYFFAYRKMRLPSYILIILLSITSIPSTLLNLAEWESGIFQNIEKIIENADLAMSLVLQILSYAYFGLTIMICLFSNWFYYRHTIKKIKKIKSDNHSSINHSQAIALAGKPRLTEILPTAILQLVLYFLTIFTANFFING